MSILLINGSPKGKNGNTELFIRHFAAGIKAPYEICYAANDSSAQIAEHIKQFDTVIFAMPLYVHAMPGIVMKIIECMEPAPDGGRALGFLVQSGFMESAQSKYLEQYLSSLAIRLNCTYLGTVIKGGSAGVSMMPEKMNRGLFRQLRALGERFSLDGTFDQEAIRALSKPVTLKRGRCRLLQTMSRMGLGDRMFWNFMLKHNKAFPNRFDRPFERVNKKERTSAE
jgi:NAD(P)H-dependent FMN reductase